MCVAQRVASCNRPRLNLKVPPKFFFLPIGFGRRREREGERETGRVVLARDHINLERKSEKQFSFSINVAWVINLRPLSGSLLLLLDLKSLGGRSARLVACWLAGWLALECIWIQLGCVFHCSRAGQTLLELGPHWLTPSSHERPTRGALLSGLNQLPTNMSFEGFLQ